MRHYLNIINEAQSSLAILNGWKYTIGEESTWFYDQGLNIVVQLSREDIDVIENLEGEELNTFLFDDFYGLMSHEMLEGRITYALSQGKIDDILKKYPKYKFSKWHPIDQMRALALSSDQLLANFSQHPTDTQYFWLGGEAHEIIISQNPREYYRFISSYQT